MKIINKDAEIIYEEKKSKFISQIFYVDSRENANLILAEIKEKYRDAAHNVFAYKIVENGNLYIKHSDDGEPKDTAGRPIAEIINYFDVSNVLLIITRYFGGIKLGAGGLIRAYAKAAKLVLENISVEEYIEKKIYIMEAPYSKIDLIDKILVKDVDIIEKNYVENIYFKIKCEQKIKEKLEEINGVIIFEA